MKTRWCKRATRTIAGALLLVIPAAQAQEYPVVSKTLKNGMKVTPVYQ